jgi:hypothetical protein
MTMSNCKLAILAIAVLLQVGGLATEKYLTDREQRPPTSVAWSLNFDLNPASSFEFPETIDFSRVESQFQPSVRGTL